LVVKASVRNTSTESNNQIYVQPNAATTNLSSRVIVGTGSAALSAAYTSDSSLWGYCTGNGSTSNTFSNSEFYFPNYAGSTNKSVSIDSVNETNATDARQIMNAGLWSSTTAISSLKFLTIENSTGNPKDFVQGSTFYLYGVAKLGTTPAIVPYATGGDTIMTDGTYWYHAFTSSGTFTPAKGLSCDVLVVAGGGGGAAGGGGGGGAGGLVAYSAQSLASGTGLTVTVGGGGATNVNGSNSQFASLTASVGGGKGGDAANGSSGGSGGGAGGNGVRTGGAGTSGQGNAGGDSNTTFPNDSGGGGGSAAAVGGTGGVLGQGGQGANGSSTYSSWGSATGTGQNVAGTYYYAGGGSGYGRNASPQLSGGFGGGGKADGSSGTANTGGGGGALGGAGGSGIVLVRYAV
jgi:hypothetical protein